MVQPVDEPGEPLDAVAGRPESPNIPAGVMDPGTVTTAPAGVFPNRADGPQETGTPSWMMPASPSPQSRCTAYTVVVSDRRTTTTAAG